MAVNKLKSDKSHGIDGILNELLILTKLFNIIFLSEFYPRAWSEAIIIPIYKKGDVNLPSKNRGINPVSCVGKIFSFHFKSPPFIVK